MDGGQETLDETIVDAAVAEEMRNAGPLPDTELPTKDGFSTKTAHTDGQKGPSKTRQTWNPPMNSSSILSSRVLLIHVTFLLTVLVFRAAELTDEKDWDR